MSARKHDSTASKVIAELKRAGRPCTTFELARAAGFQTRKDINPILYGLEREHQLKRVQETPPRWQLTHGGVMQGVSSGGGHSSRERGRGRGWGIGRGRGRGAPPTGSPAGYKFPPNPQYNFASLTLSSSALPLGGSILSVLHNAGRSLTAPEIAKALDFASHSSVNPTLHAMKKEGTLVMQQSNKNSAPLWSLPGWNFGPPSQFDKDPFCCIL